MITFLAYLYLSVGFFILGICLSAFVEDTSTPKTDVESWFVLGTAAVFWPLILPVALLSLIADHKIKLAPTLWTGVLRADLLESQG